MRKTTSSNIMKSNAEKSLFQQFSRICKLAFISMIVFFTPIQALAIYDQIAFDISVNDNTLTFSLTPDYKQDNQNANVNLDTADIKTFSSLYIAALLGSDIYFLNKNQGSLGLEKCKYSG